MNKKLVYLFAVLVAGLFVISSCEQAVGIRARNLERCGEDNRNIESEYVSRCKMVWFDDNGIVRRADYYNPMDDNCFNNDPPGYRAYYGKKMVGSGCFTYDECNSNNQIGECGKKVQLKPICS